MFEMPDLGSPVFFANGLVLFEADVIVFHSRQFFLDGKPAAGESSLNAFHFAELLLNGFS